MLSASIAQASGYGSIELMGISREILSLDKGGEVLLVQASKLEKTALDLV